MRHAIVFLIIVAYGCGKNPAESPAVPVANQGEKFQLRLDLRPGDELVYAFKQVVETKQGSSQGTTTKTTVDAELVQKCLRKTDEGFEIESVMRNPEVHVTMSGEGSENADKIAQSQKEKLTKPSTAVVDPRYRTVANGKPSTAGISFPKDAVGVGETWDVGVEGVTGRVDPGQQLNAFLPEFKCTIKGIDKIGEWKTARVDGVLKSAGMTRLPEPAVSWFDIGSGVLVRSRMKMAVDSSPLITFEIQMDLKSFKRGS